jgi:hypothetical protein
VHETDRRIGLVDSNRVIDAVSDENRAIPIYLKQPSSGRSPLTSQNPLVNAQRFAQLIRGFCYWSALLLLMPIPKSANKSRSTQGSSVTSSWGGGGAGPSVRASEHITKMIDSFQGR